MSNLANWMTIIIKKGNVGVYEGDSMSFPCYFAKVSTG